MTQNESNTECYCLKQVLLPLKESSKAAVADAVSDKFDETKRYLHLKRPIDESLLQLLRDAMSSKRKQLILVCGNVGDGKSHILSYLKTDCPELTDVFKVHNDATESFRPHRDFLDELYDLLEPFEDARLDSGMERVILAINLGTLNNFLAHDDKKCFKQLADYVDKKKVLKVGRIEDNSFDDTSSFQHVNFCDHNLFTLTPKGPISAFIEEAIEKVVSADFNNPFYEVYKKHIKTHPENCPIRYHCCPVITN